MSHYTYSIDFTKGSPFHNKYFLVPFREKVHIVFLNPVKAIEILLPHIISFIGLTFFGWNFLQMILIYFLDLIGDHFATMLKIVLNMNPESLEGVKIVNTIGNGNNRNNPYKGSLAGLKIRAVLFYSYITGIVLLVVPAFAFISFSPLISEVQWGSVLAAFGFILTSYAIEVVLFYTRKEERFTLIGNYYDRLYYKISSIAFFVILASILFMFSGIGFLFLGNEIATKPGYYYTLILFLLYVGISLPQSIAKEYYFLKKQETPGAAIIKHLRKNKITFNFFPSNYFTNKNSVILECKLGKQLVQFPIQGYEYFLIVQNNKESFGEAVLNEVLRLKNASYCTTEECEEILGYKIRKVPPFGSLFNIKTYADEGIKKNETVIVDLNLSGQIQLLTKDFIELERPVWFKL